MNPAVQQLLCSQARRLPRLRSLGILAMLASSELPPGSPARVMLAGAAPLAAGLLRSALAQRRGSAADGGWEEDADAGEASLDSMLAVLALLQARFQTLKSEPGLGVSMRTLRGIDGFHAGCACAAAGALGRPNIPASLECRAGLLVWLRACLCKGTQVTAARIPQELSCDGEAALGLAAEDGLVGALHP